jgi:ABC-2 type transport system ATP-binding protein
VRQAADFWKRSGRHQALRGLNLAVPEGSAYALTGANGAGKTTTIRILMNIIEAGRGTATVLGVDSRRLSPRELAQIGCVSENQDLSKRLTMGEYIAYLRPFYPRRDGDLEASILARFRLAREPQSRRSLGFPSAGLDPKSARLVPVVYPGAFHAAGDQTANPAPGVVG